MAINRRLLRINDEMLETIDEELELEIDDDRLAKLLGEVVEHRQEDALQRHVYFKELLRLQGELVKLQDWVQHNKFKVVVIFEGRDSAGKGGVIKRITQRLNPRICRVAALPAPSERERTQWYFQRYVAHLPAGGEIVLFDRSWYNRAGVERVMGFCTEDEYQEFFHSVPEFERMLVRSGVHSVEILVLDHRRGAAISLPHAHPRFAQAMEAQPDGCAVPGALGAIHQGQGGHAGAHAHPRGALVDRRGGQQEEGAAECISHLLSQIPYQLVHHEPITLPPRVHNPEYYRGPIPEELYVPEIY